MRLCVSGPEGTGKSALARSLAAQLEVAVVDVSDEAIMGRMRGYTRLPDAEHLGVLERLRKRHPEEYLNLLENLVEDQAQALQRLSGSAVSSWSPVDAAALALHHCRGPGQWPALDRFIARCVQLASRSYELVFYLDPDRFVAEGAGRRIVEPKYLAEIDLTTRGLYQRGGIELVHLTSTGVEQRVAEALPRARNGPYLRIPDHG